ncbi:MAG: sigma-70 family RNA polymerase sigma factor [Clostridia bacterium]
MNYEFFTDEELVFMAQKGDNESINQLLYRYKKLVKSIARKFFLVGGETDDLIQEGMVALYHAVSTFNVDKNALFKTFASRCIRCQIYDAIKSASRGKHRALNEFVSLNENAVELAESDDGDPESAYLAEESLLAIETKIKQVLSDNEREIFDLYLSGHSYIEIGHILNVSSKKVDNSLQKIKKTLKRAL